MWGNLKFKSGMVWNKRKGYDPNAYNSKSNSVKNRYYQRYFFFIDLLSSDLPCGKEMEGIGQEKDGRSKSTEAWVS